MFASTGNHAANRPAEEDEPLLPASRKVSTTKALGARLRNHLNEDVSLERADLILLYAYFLTGLLDTSATAMWGTFVSMQTGNTVFLALGLAGPATSSRWIKSGISLLSFCIGSFFFSRLHQAVSPRRRWVLLVGIIIQVLCIAAAALIVTFTPQTDEPGNGHDLHWHILLPLSLVAFQSSGQAVVSRTLKHRTLTSVALTSLYCDLFSDEELVASIADNVERNRRVAAISMLFVGALCGGAWSKLEIGMTGALWTAVVMKSAYIVAWWVWKAEDKEGEYED
jgi:uncharacterized membrane protein YoaK (UPF0700 family)